MIILFAALLVHFKKTDFLNEYINKYDSVNTMFWSFTNEKDLIEIIRISSELLGNKATEESGVLPIKKRLNLMKNEANYILMLKKETQKSLLENIKILRKIQDRWENNINDYNEREMEAAINNVKINCCNNSLIIYHAICFKAACDISKDSSKYSVSKIDIEYSKYENVFGKSDPELWKLLTVYLKYYQEKKDLKMIEKYSLELKKLVPIGYPNRYDIIFNADLMYMQTLSVSKELLSELYLYHKKIDKNELIKFNLSNIDSRILYFRICAKMYEDLNSPYRMIEMQEFLVDALVYKYKKKENRVVKIQAAILRDMLADNKQTNSFRKIESDFNLTPLPKQSGE